MKNLLGLALICSTIVLASCSNEPAPAAATQPAPVKEVIVTTPAPAPPPVVVIKKDPPAKSTVISLDKSGVKVETKKVKVVLGKDN